MTARNDMEEGGAVQSALVYDVEMPHRIEFDVRRQLMADPALRFSSLVIRRVADGVCLEGVLESDADLSDVEQTVAAIAGVNRVLNRLVLKRPAPKG